MHIQKTLRQLKLLLEKKGTKNQHPRDNAEAIILQEQNIDSSFTYSVGVGVVKSNESTSRYFDLTGRVYDDTMQKFYESNLRIEPKLITTTKGLNYTCVVFFPSG